MSNHEHEGWDLYLFSIKTRRYKRITRGGFNVSPTLSPDRKWIACVSGEGNDMHPYHIWIINLSTGNSYLITPGTQWDTSPAWSPDGKSIVYCSRQSNETKFGFYLIQPDGSGKIKIDMNNNIQFAPFPSWSPDSKKIILSGKDISNKIGIYNYNLENKQLSVIYINEKFTPLKPKISPDGKKIVFTSGNNIFTIDNNGNYLKQLTYGYADREPSWSPDSKKVVFTRIINGKSDIWIMKDDGSDQKRLTEQSGDNVFPIWAR